MLSKNFYLKSTKPNKKGEVPIIMSIGIRNGRPFIIHIKKSIRPEYWSKQRQKATKRGGAILMELINKEIRIYDKRVDEIYYELIEKKIPITEKRIKQELKDTFFQPENEKQKKEGFFDYLEQYINSNKSFRAENTIKGYITVKNFLLQFQEFSKIKLNFDFIDESFMDNFRTYCFTKKKTNSNYFAKIVNVLKSFMKWSFDRNYHQNIHYQKFKAPEKEKEVIFLAKDELQNLYNYDFQNNRLSSVRDLFCFSCFTGLRFSDVVGLQWSNIKEQEIKITTKKTKQELNIPLNPFAKSIIEKHKGELLPLPSYSSQKVNKYIKEACKIVGINESVNNTKYIGSKVIKETKPKYEYISFHTARKTFVTLSLFFGMNTKTIKEITGHKKDDVFNKYLKITEDFKSQQMKNTWNQYFTKED